jgi:pyrimidine-specific ribonucleoside hydrolase
LPRHVLVDTDLAFDDWLAILCLLRHPQAKVSAITVAGTGEAHSVPGGRNALGLLAPAGFPGVPVALGREEPLAGGHAFPDPVRQIVDDALGLALPPIPIGPLIRALWCSWSSTWKNAVTSWTYWRLVR